MNTSVFDNVPKKTSTGEAVLGHTYELVFRIYTFIGRQKIRSKTKWTRYIHGAYYYQVNVWMHSLLPLPLIDAFLKRGHMQLLINNLCITAISLINQIKYLTFNQRKNEVDKMRINLASNWCLPKIGENEEDRKILHKTEQEIFILLVLILSSGFISISFAALTPTLDYTRHERILPSPFPKIVPIKKKNASLRMHLLLSDLFTHSHGLLCDVIRYYLLLFSQSNLRTVGYFDEKFKANPEKISWSRL